MTSSTVSSMMDDIKEALSDHVVGGLCADGLHLPVSKIPVGCLDFLHEFAFSDRVSKEDCSARTALPHACSCKRQTWLHTELVKQHFTRSDG